MRRSTLLLMTTPMAVLACLASLWLAAPAPALAEGPGGGFGSRTAVVGSGTAATQGRAVADFQAIRTSGPFRVTVRQTGRESVEVTADDNLLPLLETVVENPVGGPRTLHLRWKPGETVRPRSEIRIVVEVARLQALSSQGTGDVTVESLQTDRFALSLAGSGDARLPALRADRTKISIAGSGNVVAAGGVGQLDLSIAGSGDIRAADLRADEVKVSIAGSGDVTVHAERTLEVSIAGSGDVRYGGAPSVRSRVAGSGTVRTLR